MTPAEVEEVKRHFNVVAEQLSGQVRLVAEGVSGLDAKIDREIAETRHEARLVAEGLAAVSSKIDREIGSLREEMRSEFEETRAMIRLSYSELDQRIRRLEDGFTTLEVRVGKLEAR